MKTLLFNTSLSFILYIYIYIDTHTRKIYKIFYVNIVIMQLIFVITW